MKGNLFDFKIIIINEEKNRPYPGYLMGYFKNPALISGFYLLQARYPLPGIYGNFIETL